MTKYTLSDIYPASIFIVGVVVGAVLDDRMAAQDDQKQLMCQIVDHSESIHLMPCRIVDSYLAEVNFK